MGRGYSGNHPRFSKRADERYDAKEAYNKDLTASARLHYLENVRHDHESPAHRHNRSHRLRERAMRISEGSGAERGDAYDYEDPKVQKLLAKANELDERSNKKKDSPMKMEGKGCAKSEGGSGCVVKRGDEYVILNNKKGGIFQSGFKSKQAAERSLAGYHANK